MRVKVAWQMVIGRANVAFVVVARLLLHWRTNRQGSQHRRWVDGTGSQDSAWLAKYYWNHVTLLALEEVLCSSDGSANICPECADECRAHASTVSLDLELAWHPNF